MWFSSGEPRSNAFSRILSPDSEKILQDYYNKGFQIISVDARGTGDDTFLSKYFYALNMWSNQEGKLKHIVEDNTSHKYKDVTKIFSQYIFHEIYNNTKYISSHHNACDILYINQLKFNKKDINLVGASYGGVALTKINNILKEPNNNAVFGELKTAIFDSAVYNLDSDYVEQSKNYYKSKTTDHFLKIIQDNTR